jgi:CRP-like cAMP-binding protein
VDPSSILTTSALLTAVVGLSLQDTLGNLFAGLAIQAQTPFEIGDWIQYDEVKTHVGQVLEINWRATKMRTIDDVEVIVPNSKLATAAISNYSKPTPSTRRLVTIHGPYSAPPLRIKQVLLAAAKTVPGVLDHPAPDVNSIGYDEYGIQYQIRFYIDRFEERQVIDGEVLDRVWYAMRRAQLPLPVPQRRITMLQHSQESQKVARLEQVAERERSLHHVDFLSCLPDELFHELAERCEKRLYAAGEAIIRQGEGGSELFIIESGQVEILIEKRVSLSGSTIPPPAKDGSVKNKKGVRTREIKVAELGAGRFFGELSLLTGEERNATVRARGEVSVLVVSKEDLAPIFEASPELLERISTVLSERSEADGEQDDDLDFDDVAETGRQSVLLLRIKKFFSL